MFGSRQAVQPRLRHAAASFGPVPRSFPRGSKNARLASSFAVRPPFVPQASWRKMGIILASGLFGYSCANLACEQLLGTIDIASQKEPPAEVPGSEGDLQQLERIRQRFDNELPLVKQLREDPDFTEANVYGNYSGDDHDQRLTSGPLRGSRGLALQRVFWNHKEKKAINVVYLGWGTSGWPKVVHGGALATVLDEHLARVAVRYLPERTAVTANLNLDYRHPAWTDNFFSIHATLDQERSTDRKAYVKGEVRNAKGQLITEASALFVVPRGYKLPKLGESY